MFHFDLQPRLAANTWNIIVKKYAIEFFAPTDTIRDE
jgi:hypothetical protein